MKLTIDQWVRFGAAPWMALLSLGLALAAAGDETQPRDLAHWHGKRVTGFVAPYLLASGIDGPALQRQLLSPGRAAIDHSDELWTYLGSEEHQTGDWTHSLVRGPFVYQLKRLGDGRSIVLWNDVSPALLRQQREPTWLLTLVDREQRPLSTIRLLTPIRVKGHLPWDMVYTTLQIAGRDVTATIRYSETGSGPGLWNQRFVARCRYDGRLLKRLEIERQE